MNNLSDQIISKNSYADRVKAASFVNLGEGTPFDIIGSSSQRDTSKNFQKGQLITGNPYILQLFEQYRQKHPIDVPVHNIESNYAIAGDFVDIGRYMSGEPECMVDYSQSSDTRFVDFYINIDVCHNISRENSFAYYAAAISVIDSLENSNYRVRLIGVNYSDAISVGKIYEVTTIIKDHSEPINYAYLTSICMADTAFFAAMMLRPKLNLYSYKGCDSLPGFEPNVLMNENTFYAPSLYGTNRFGKKYSEIADPKAFSFNELIQDWKLDHLLAK
ncbi:MULTISPECIES: hypothetical protein [unclassified Spirosoma]|uniref:DUF7192 family protein n=1 Tax=unclassified Spirosoma TaxID=2621999 RepID=UPI0009640D13|nr:MULTISPECIES: hypothetical protein [unclassified Spirosoma]MBN8824465.1 hypothetical protein [Spirosoma sp.]OJW70071.1 MAG: hypothetical protein BGO59_25695 [Spirosoma sp. 48-14]